MHHETDPQPSAYFEHARVINEAARLLLRLDTRDTTSLHAKISIGLSLQATELAGKGILRALGDDSTAIRKTHSQHNIVHLLQTVDKRIRDHQNPKLRTSCDFMRWQPEINGVQFGTTIGQYFTSHFAHGPISHPRNYFYPDHAAFSGPEPIHAIHLMVEYIISCGEALNASLAGGALLKT